MKTLSLFLFTFLHFTCLFGQVVKTSADNSPAIIAQNISVIYGVRADAVEAIIWVFEAKGYDIARRRRATEQIIKEYAQSPEKRQKAGELSEATRRKLGINDAPKIANALEWDLFARKHYISTTGQNSPSVVTKGDVNIWYGIPPKALRALAAQLEKNKSNLSNFETQLVNQVKKYEELKTELETYSGREEIYGKAEALLEEGRLEEADKLISSDFSASMKRQAYKGFIFGKTKELNLQYDSAAVGFKNAINNDERNTTYHLNYANNENTLAHYDLAIKHYEIALGIDSLKRDNDERIATLINNLGSTLHSKGEYEKAIGYFEKALQMDVKALGEKHTTVAIRYNNLGEAWREKGEYEKAIGYFEKALQIYLKALGPIHPNVANGYGNLGLAWNAKGYYDKAIGYYEKAQQIFLKAFGEDHPKVANGYSNLGVVLSSKREYDKAIGYYKKALQIDLKVFGEIHPSIATGYNNIGVAWKEKGEYDKAIVYYEKALQIALKVFGEKHPSVATKYNNLGGAWDSKGEYDKAMAYYDKALQIDLKTFGENHPYVARDYNNLGGAWQAKREYDKAIRYFEKALQIDLKTFGENHPYVARDYNNLGFAWQAKRYYDKAIGYFEECQKILDIFFEPSHPNQKTTAQNLSRVANSRGLELSGEKNLREALRYFEKALQNAQKARDDAFSIICLNSIGSMQKQLQEYAAALQTLDTGLEKAAQINAQIDKAIQQELTPEMLANPEVQAEITEMRNLVLIRCMQYNKVGCLKGLKRDKEAEALVRLLWQECIKTNDTRLLENLKKEGYDFGGID